MAAGRNFERGVGLSHEDAHVFAGEEGSGKDGRELDAIGGDAFDVELVDAVLDLVVTANQPDLHFFGLGWIVSEIGQQFVELCRHGFDLVLGMVKGLEAMAYPTTFMNKVCDRLR